MTDLVAIAGRVRRAVLTQIYTAGGGHPGGSLSAAELMVYVYSIKTESDYFILSKGHASPAWYATLAAFNIIEPERLKTFRKLGGLQGHPSPSLKEVVTPTGSLGQGAAVGVGIAQGLKYARKPGRVMVLLGDGELQEGIVWEAANTAARYHLDNLWWIVDFNGLQSDAPVWDTAQTVLDKFKVFGWWADMTRGHDFEYMDALFKTFANSTLDKPRVAIAMTTKGGGVSFMESRPEWHGSVVITDEQYAQAMKELE